MVSSYAGTGERGFDVRMLVAYLLFFAFGYFCSTVLGHYTPRQLGTFWPFYIGEAFPLWMAFVNGGGLILGGLWMRRD
jgi:hypothetical protein